MYKNKQESDTFLSSTVGRKSQNIVVTHPATPHFLLPSFKTFVTHPPKINESDNVVTPTPSSDPDNPPKFGTCTSKQGNFFQSYYSRAQL